MLSNRDITAFYDEIGERLKASRKLKNITQDELSNFLGISRVSLVNIENGKQKAPVHVLLEISQYLKIPLSELLPPIYVSDETIDPAIINKVNKETGRAPESGDKAISFIKAYISKK